jgi:hypothetical protein
MTQVRFATQLIANSQLDISTLSDSVEDLGISDSRDSVDSFEHVPPVPARPRMAPPQPQSQSQSQQPAQTKQKARLIYAKSHVAIHPTQLKRDHISGLLGLVEVERDAGAPRVPDSAPRAARTAAGAKEVLVVWVPDDLFRRMPEEDKRNYQRVEERPNGTPTEEDGMFAGVASADQQLTTGYVFVSLPPPRGEKYAFSVPVSHIYSLLVYPVSLVAPFVPNSQPSLSCWYGSVTFK